MTRKKIQYILSASGILLLLIVFFIYNSIFGISVSLLDKPVVLFISDGSSFTMVVDSIEKYFSIENPKVLRWVAMKKKYPDHIKSGKYVIDKDLSYNSLINLLRSGSQTPVNLTFNNIRTLSQLAGKISKQIEADSSSIMNFLSDESNYSSDGFKKEDIIAMFLPNTYEIYWDTSPKELYDRMLKEYHKFWNEKRLAQAKEEGISPVEVAILASIIDDEVTKADEKPRIAGVYLNRLKRGIPLQACPTIKFALNDFTITRVLYVHLQTDSPYNTYRHRGFPPGPIGCPTIEGIDAVLNAEKHNYFYFAAKADFSGYHNFSRTLAEHNHYAAIYQRELDKRKIFK